MKLAGGVLGVALVLAMSAGRTWAQPPGEDTKPGAVVTQTFYLKNVSQKNDANEVVTALRNIVDPRSKIFFVFSENAIVVQAGADQMVLVNKLIHDLDRPKNLYRLGYTITEIDGGKRLGTQHFSMIVAPDQRTTLKQGSKVPVATGSYDPGKSAAQTQFTYLDVGMNFDVTASEFANGVSLRTKVEQSSIAEEKSTAGFPDPIVRQAVLEGTSFLTVGKPLVLGSLDISGSTRHLDIEVVLEKVM